MDIVKIHECSYINHSSGAMSIDVVNHIFPSCVISCLHFPVPLSHSVSSFNVMENTGFGDVC